MNTIDRRTFLASTLVCGTGLFACPARAIEPIKRTGKAKLTLSLAAYSFNRYLNLRGKNKPTMTLEEFIDFGGKQELPAVELTAYYFPKTTPEYLKEILARCRKHALVVSGTAVGNDFCQTSAEAQQKQLTDVKRWIEHSAMLGAKTMRIFAGNVKKGDTEENARKRCVEAIHEACDHAAKHKVLLALENHGGITGTAEQLLQIVRAVKHEWFGVNLDTGNFRTEDPYADLEKIAPYAVVAQVKTEITPKGKKKEEADLERLMNMFRKVGYQGYVALEYEAAEDPRLAVPRYLKELKKYMG